MSVTDTIKDARGKFSLKGELPKGALPSCNGKVVTIHSVKFQDDNDICDCYGRDWSAMVTTKSFPQSITPGAVSYTTIFDHDDLMELNNMWKQGETYTMKFYVSSDCGEDILAAFDGSFLQFKIPANAQNKVITVTDVVNPTSNTVLRLQTTSAECAQNDQKVHIYNIELYKGACDVCMAGACSNENAHCERNDQGTAAVCTQSCGAHQCGEGVPKLGVEELACPGGDCDDDFCCEPLYCNTYECTDEELELKYVAEEIECPDETCSDTLCCQPKQVVLIDGVLPIESSSLTSTYDDTMPSTNCHDDVEQFPHSICHGGHQGGDTLKLTLEHVSVVKEIRITNRGEDGLHINQRLTNALVKAGGELCAQISNEQSKLKHITVHCASEPLTKTITIETFFYLNMKDVKVHGVVYGMCEFTPGFGTGEGQEKINDHMSGHRCAQECFKDKKYNGVSIKADGSGGCWCKIGMSGQNDHPDFLSCYIREAEEPPQLLQRREAILSTEYHSTMAAKYCIDDYVHTICHGKEQSGDTLTIKLQQMSKVFVVEIINRLNTGGNLNKRLEGAVVKAGGVQCGSKIDEQTSLMRHININCPDRTVTDTITIETEDYLNFAEVKVRGIVDNTAEVEEEENTLWNQIMGDYTRCNDNTQAFMVEDQKFCQGVAVENDHKYYQYYETGKYCLSYDSCNSWKYVGPNGWNWKVYSTETPPENELWDQIYGDYVRCNDNLSTFVVADQKACQGEAVLKGHQYYQYYAPDKRCLSYASCNSFINIPPTGWNWKVFSNAPNPENELWNQIRGDYTRCDDSVQTVVVADQKACQDSAVLKSHEYYQYYAPEKRCLSYASCNSWKYVGPNGWNWKVYSTQHSTSTEFAIGDSKMPDLTTVMQYVMIWIFVSICGYVLGRYLNARVYYKRIDDGAFIEMEN